MRVWYHRSDEKFVKAAERRPPPPHPLTKFSFRLNAATRGFSDSFNKKDVPIVFKCSPDTLLNLCSKIVDAMPLVNIYEWNIEHICRWLRQLGYRQYQNTFRENLINGRTLLLLDASALSAMNIRDFTHTLDIAYRIRMLFFYEMTTFGRSISLPSEFLFELYKLFRTKTGKKYEDVRRVDLWRRMQIIREKAPNYSHWELLERLLAKEKDRKSYDRFGYAPRHKLYKCSNTVAVEPEKQSKARKLACYCLPPCDCHWKPTDLRVPWRFKFLSYLPAEDDEFVLNCPTCLNPCTCRWNSKKFMTHGVLSCLRKAFPQKYSGTYQPPSAGLSKIRVYRLSAS
uniref:SAM domain-containing protein n=1 Tax=Glossina palpalis gambiensis TaxID=67801 RepID=A0A1B0BLW7_9MUSC